MMKSEIYILLAKYFRVIEEQERKDAEASLQKIQEEFDKDQKQMEKFKFELEHPEYAPISPKEYGMKLLKRKRK